MHSDQMVVEVVEEEVQPLFWTSGRREGGREGRREGERERERRERGEREIHRVHTSASSPHINVNCPALAGCTEFDYTDPLY